MKKKSTQHQTLAISLFCLMMASVSGVYADGFYTIIGPDGRPMVVPMKIGKKELEPNKQKQELRTEKAPASVIDHSNTVKPAVEPVQQKKIESSQSSDLGQNPSKITKKIDVTEPVITIAEPKIESSLPAKVINKDSEKVVSKTVEKSKATQTSSNTLTIEKPIIDKKSAIIEKAALTHSASNEVLSSTGFSQVDGVKYVNSEYLENQEFNLDGKKRFYTMPDGTGRLETIERKKGVSRSVLDKLLNRSQQSTAPIALAGTYVRLSSEDLKSAFENDRCFIDGYKKSIKTLKPNKDVGLWPRKPLKEKFEYELVKIDPAIQYMQIDSYSSNSEKPVYYWPLVVFLDEKGCIEEGVSGFKSTKTVATVLQHSAIQGVIKVPQGAHYMMMTPLASAVDVSEPELSNQGQLKISVLQ
ncbi:putative pilus assembly protein FilE [Acinetobacter colistiniresistens]|uniref:putative pilus assembly protein FilE n=1 Tax=Acinetobacter TaxID=469 RepID=UPI0005C534B7|nr:MULTISPECIES: putative pilus assembly protein FilE [Acinetobacter]UUM27579.1 putative pilus assembly protein FilE [Acinetobacter colistiniresistens]